METENLSGLRSGNERSQACGHEGYVHFLDYGNSFTVYVTPKSQLMEGTSQGRRMSQSIITLPLGLWGSQLVSSLFPTSTRPSPCPGDWSSGHQRAWSKAITTCLLATYNGSPHHLCASTEDLVLARKMFRANTCAVVSCLIIPIEWFMLTAIITVIITAQFF